MNENNYTLQYYYEGIEVEKKNLEQQFSKFKQIIDQFNLSFTASLDSDDKEE